MAARRVLKPPRKGLRFADVVYGDDVGRGSSRLPRQRLATAPISADVIETIPSYGLRSLIFDKTGQHHAVEKIRIVKPPIDLLKGKYADYSLYEDRHKFPGYRAILELIDKGCIIEAMTRFYLASRSWSQVYHGKLRSGYSDFEISPHIIHDLVERLSRLATMAQVEWEGFTEKIDRESYWIPTQIGNRVDVRDMDIPTLAFHALVDVYDIGGAIGISLDPTATGAMLHANSYHLDVALFTKFVDLTLLRQGGDTFEQASLELAHKIKVSHEPQVYKRVDFVVVKEIIEGYGRLGSPEWGESFAQEWSSHIATSLLYSKENRLLLEQAWHSARDRGGKSNEAPAHIYSSGWAHDMRIWSALIRSRASASDLAGARHWLQCYRREGLKLAKAKCGSDCCGPHIAYISALTSFKGSRGQVREGSKRGLSYIENGKTRYDAIISAIRLIHQDGGAMTEDLLTTCINLHLGFNKLAEAAAMIKLLLQRKDSLAALRPSFYRIFFHLHRAVHSRQKMDIHQLGKLVRQGGNDNAADHLANLRGLYQDFYWKLNIKQKQWSRNQVKEALKEALRASLSARDLPLASVVLETFKEYKFPATDQIQSIVAGQLSDKDDRPSPSKSAKAAKHQSIIVDSVKKWLKANDTQKTPYQETVFTSTYVEDAGRYHKVLDILIRLVNSQIVQDVHRGKQYLESNDPEWLKNVCSEHKGLKDDDHEKILEVVLSPIWAGLKKTTKNLAEVTSK
jgi:hypothetical protein